MKKTIKNIPTSRFSRGLRLAGLTASVGAQALTSRVGSMFASEAEKQAARLFSQVKQAKKIADTLSQMKGAAMKLGQILSIHGDHLFPKEVTEILSKLQQHSDHLEFEEIEKVLVAELGADYATRLTEFAREPIAAASIGQVYRAVDARDGGAVAVKVQYPGVDTSIDSDVDSMASLFSVLTRIPSAEGFNAVTDEIKALLKQETDYRVEGRSVEFFHDYFSGDESLVVPRYFPELSTGRVLTTSLENGISVQEFAESTASDKARELLGKKYLEVFYHEIFQAGRVQTDPNFANYKIQWSFGVHEPKLVLLDFGAVKAFSEEFRSSYKELVRVCLAGDYDAIRDHAVGMGFLRADDGKELVDMHYELVRMIMEPFVDDKPYCWHESDLPERIRKFAPKFVFAFKLRPPPKDIIFLNRKIVGVYFFCSAIRSRFNPREILNRFLA